MGTLATAPNYEGTCAEFCTVADQISKLGQPNDEAAN